MKITLEFEDEEMDSAINAINGNDTLFTLHEIQNWFRNEVKHGSDHYTPAEYETLTTIRAKILDLIDDKYRP